MRRLNTASDAREKANFRRHRLWVVLASLFLFCQATAGLAQTGEVDVDVYTVPHTGYLGVADFIGIAFDNGGMLAGGLLVAHARDIGTSPGFGMTYEYAMSRNTPRRVKPTVAGSLVTFDHSPGALGKRFNGMGVLSAGARILILRAPQKSLSLRILAFSGRLFGQEPFPGMTTRGALVGVAFHTISSHP